jgi:YD repeat-containing protein
MVFAISLFIPNLSSAQIQVLSYTGPGYSYSDCILFGGTSSNCIANGSVIGSVTLNGVPANFTGITTNSQVSSFSLSASGVGTVTTDLNGATFYFANGILTGWNIGAGNSTTVHKTVTIGGDNNYDQGALYDGSGLLLKFGIVTTPPAHGYWISSKALGVACSRPGASSCGEPIDLGSGNMFSVAEDYSTVGQNPLAFIRTYNSMANSATYATSMGSNWRHNYDRYLTIYADGITAERPDGQVISFSSNSGTYTSDSDVDMRLANPSGSTWTLTDGEDTIETYTAASGKGTLNSIKLRNGYTQAINYSSGQVSFVSDSYSRQIGFTYSSAGLLTSITTPDAQTISYGYVNFSSTNQNLLTSVSY